MPEKHIIDRAKELASSGGFSGTNAIVEQLSREGYSHAGDHLLGLGIRRELRSLRKAARENGAREAQPPIILVSQAFQGYTLGLVWSPSGHASAGGREAAEMRSWCWQTNQK